MAKAVGSLQPPGCGEFAIREPDRWRICSLRTAENLPEDPSGGELRLQDLRANSPQREHRKALQIHRSVFQLQILRERIPRKFSGGHASVRPIFLRG